MTNEWSDQIFFLNPQEKMSARELRSLGVIDQQPNLISGFVTRSGKTQNQQVVAAQNERKQRIDRRNRAFRSTRAIVRRNMGSRPFTIQEQFGGVWRTFAATPFEDLRRYDYEQWVFSFSNQMRRKTRSELEQGAYKIFSTADAYYIRGAQNEDEIATLREKNHALRREYGRNLPNWAFDVRKATLLPIGKAASIISNVADANRYILHAQAGYLDKVVNIANNLDTAWSFWKGLDLSLKFTQYNPFGAKHCKLPTFISKKACMVNIQNQDDRCLEYAIICAKHFKDHENDSNKERPSKWTKWLGALKFDGLKFPIHTSDIHKVERMNNLAINVYALRDEKCAKDAFKSNLFLAHQTKRTEAPIILFLYRQHYMYVHDWKRLTNSDGEHKFHCPTCLLSFCSQENLDKHCVDCSKSDPMNTTMPKQHSVVKFEKHMNTTRHPIAIYSDFEALNKSGSSDLRKGIIATQEIRKGNEVTQELRKGIIATQDAVSNGIQIECDISLSIPSYVDMCEMSQDDSVHDMLIEKLRDIEKVVRAELFDDEKDMSPLTSNEKSRHKNSKKCPHCNWKYGKQRWGKKEEDFHTVTKVRDHDHRTGKYRTDLCVQCNLSVGKAEKKKGRFIPVYFHGGTNYDYHHMIKSLAKNDVEFESMTCIPKNNEKYTSFTWKPLPCPKEEYMEMKQRTAKLKSWLQSQKYSKEEKQTWKDELSELKDRMNASLEIRFMDTSAFMMSSLESLLINLPDEQKTRLREISKVHITDCIHRYCHLHPNDTFKDLRNYIRQKGYVCTKEYIKDVLRGTPREIPEVDTVFDEEVFEFIKTKGHFPYEWFDSVEKLKQTSLPSHEHWNSKLTRSYIEDESCLTEAYQTWKFFQMKTFKDWHDHYLKIDVKGLSDVFEAFRSLCMDIYKVDPCYYFTAPGMFNDALYKKTGARVELIIDVDMYNFFEKGIRGGLSVQVNRFSKANHLHLNSHNRNDLTKYILYTDANNLYGYAMKQPLPYKHFEWEATKTTEEWVNHVKHMHTFEKEWLNRQNDLFREKHSKTRFPDDWGSRSDDASKRSPVAGMLYGEAKEYENGKYLKWAKCQTNRMRNQPLDLFVQYCDGVTLDESESVGLTLEVDLKYPEHLHDRHSDYPLAPESITVSDEDLLKSEWSKTRLNGNKRVSCRKLCATLKNKSEYVVHWRTLNLYLELGMEVTKVHRVVSYIEKPWMKDYIELNESNRKKAKNDFEKDFFKLANNSVFGKQMENVRKRFRPLVWCTSEKDLLNESKKPSYTGDCTKFSDTLIAVHHMKTDVCLNKPIQVGQAILDLSKECMYNFHYNVMLPKFESDLKLLMTDTDSLVYEISSSDPEYDMYKDLETIKQEFDFSDYPKDHPLYDATNKKIAGKFKDDKSTIIKEFCGIRAKMYSMLLAGYGDIADTDGKHLVKDYESGKEKKGWKRDANGDLIKSKAYLNHDGMQRNNTTSAYETFTTKGIKKSVADGELRHNDFKRCLLDNKEAPRVYIPTLRSVNHQVYMFDSEKKTLDALDDKRHTLIDGCDSLAHGHYRICNGYIHKYEKVRKPVQRMRRTAEQEYAEMEAINDAPLVRMREIKKRHLEEHGVRQKKKRQLLSLEEMRAWR